MVYQWRDGARWRGKAQEVGERLEELRAGRGGFITPDAVVTVAAKDDDPLHPLFEWNDAKAAHAFRLATARELIADVMVVYADELEGASTEPVRAFASVGTSANASAYTSTLEAMRSPAMRADVLAQAKRELEGWRRRYKVYQELAAVVQRVDAALAEIPQMVA
jgi:hypothetical protein